MDEAKFANDFEERHGWSPDIDYELIREMWWELGEAVMREMCEEDDDD